MGKRIVQGAAAVAALTAAAVAVAAVCAASASATSWRSALAVRIVVEDHLTHDRLAAVSVGQLIDIQAIVSGDTDLPVDDYLNFVNTAKACIVQGPCRRLESITEDLGEWTVRVQPSWIINRILTIEATWKEQTLALRSLPLRSLEKAPQPRWDKSSLNSPIDVCFGTLVPPHFSALLRVEHSYRDANNRLKREGTRTVRFRFKPNKGFVTPTYRGRAYRDTLFDGYCLDISPTLRGAVRKRVGFFSFTYIYRGKKISTARYKYSIEKIPGRLAKEGSDEFFNYCLKQHPETIFSSGGVLMCAIPGGTFISYNRR